MSVINPRTCSEATQNLIYLLSHMHITVKMNKAMNTGKMNKNLIVTLNKVIYGFAVGLNNNTFNVVQFWHISVLCHDYENI